MTLLSDIILGDTSHFWSNFIVLLILSFMSIFAFHLVPLLWHVLKLVGLFHSLSFNLYVCRLGFLCYHTTFASCDLIFIPYLSYFFQHFLQTQSPCAKPIISLFALLNYKIEIDWYNHVHNAKIVILRAFGECGWYSVV